MKAKRWLDPDDDKGCPLLAAGFLAAVTTWALAARAGWKRRR